MAALVRGRGLRLAPHSPQQLRAHRVEQVVSLEIEPIYQSQRLISAIDFRDDHGPIERNHRARRQRHPLIVDREDLAPVGVRRIARVTVDRVDGGLQLVRTGAIALPGIRAAAPGLPRCAFDPRRCDPGSASCTNAPCASTRAARRASMSSISASSPRTSGSCGISSSNILPSRTASSHNSPRNSSAPDEAL